MSLNDGIQAGIIDACWQSDVDRLWDGTPTLRCKVQLEGASDYVFDNNLAVSSNDACLIFLHHPPGHSKYEKIRCGMRERSITLVLPFTDEQLACYDRADSAVSRAIDADYARVRWRRMRLPRFAAGLAKAVLEADKSGRHYRKRRSAQLDELTCSLVDIYLGRFEADGRAAPTARELREVREAAAMLLSDLANTPQLATLASAVGTNRTTLNRGFKAVFGVTPFQLLMQARMDQARRLLEQPDLSVTDIAAQCGYEHISNFSISFKAFHGVGPSRFRREGNVPPLLQNRELSERIASVMGKPWLL